MESISTNTNDVSLNDISTRRSRIFDWLGTLEADTDLSFIDDLTNQFENHSEELLKGMQDDFLLRQSKGLAFKAHKLKSAAGNLGSTHAWQMCQNLEFLCQNENWDEISQVLGNLNQECVQTFLLCKEFIFLKRQKNQTASASDK